MMADIKLLVDLKPGQIGVVNKITGEGSVKRRLLDMGIVKGTIIEIERVAPFGDPIEVKVKGYHVSLRKDEAADIYVEVRKNG